MPYYSHTEFQNGKAVETWSFLAQRCIEVFIGIVYPNLTDMKKGKEE
jgi:hypothetical protein